jgi:hypothetical protein
MLWIPNNILGGFSMELLAGIFLIVLGVFMLIKPKIMWKIADSWKTKTNAEPTNLYLNIIRTAGCILIFGGILSSLQK